MAITTQQATVWIATDNAVFLTAEDALMHELITKFSIAKDTAEAIGKHGPQLFALLKPLYGP